MTSPRSVYRFLTWGAIPLAALLWSMALPNSLFGDGLGFLAWIAPAPAFFFVRRKALRWAPVGGVFFGVFLLLFSQSWLFNFQPVAFTVVSVIEIPQYALAFWALGWADKVWKRAPWLQAAIWTAFEFLRTQGFLGYPYASLASTQWQYPFLLQTADWAGPWLVTFWIAAFAAWSVRWFFEAGTFSRRDFFWSVGPFLALSAGISIQGFLGWFSWNSQEVHDARWSFALVQHVQDPWRGGSEAYETGLDKLIDLTEKAERDHRVQTVVWSETAFVPSVFYHLKYRDTPDSTRLVLRLMDWLRTRPESFLIGNDHREKVLNSAGREVIRDWNAVLAWNGGWTGLYRKRRLVPFTESFPFRRFLPWVWDWLKANDTHFWEAGTEASVLKVSGLPVGTPVCFEDAFGDTCRPFVQNGAKVLVNLTDDSWSGSIVPMRLHLALSVWRAVENRVPLVRCANGGTTAVIWPDGRVAARLPEFVPGVLKAEVPVSESQETMYTRYGDFVGWLAAVIVLVLILIDGLRRFFTKRTKSF